MVGITYIKNFIAHPNKLFTKLKHETSWDERMIARKTASFGKAYNYSQINYPFQEFNEELAEIVDLIYTELGFKPNNCLINFYLDGESKMGYHSDQTNILYENTGVAIVSIGEMRTLRFRNIEDKKLTQDFELPTGSLIFMTNKIQSKWQHSVPKSETNKGRMSLTFRKIK